MSAKVHIPIQWSRRDRRAILCLLLLIVSSHMVYFWLPNFISPNDTNNKVEFDAWVAHIQKSTSYTAEVTPSRKLSLHPFDPNTLTEQGFRDMGLREKLIQTILHYREKGGQFYRPESVQRIYGMTENEYAQLKPFIRIDNSNHSHYPGFSPPKKLHIELNSCDTGELVKLNGIGSRMAMNIVQYRSQLGGFVDKKQLMEVYGMPPSTYERIQSQVWVKSVPLRTLSLNEITLAELNQHPYFKGELAKAVVEFRRAHDYKIENLDQLKEIALINDKIFRKIVPYIRLH
jgi:competence protein ComEA